MSGKFFFVENAHFKASSGLNKIDICMLGCPVFLGSTTETANARYEFEQAATYATLLKTDRRVVISF